MKKLFLSPLLFILLPVLAFQSCTDQEAPNIPAPRLTIEEAATVNGRTSATIRGIISRQAGTEIAECGFLYSTVSTIPEEEAETYPLSPDANGTQSAQLTGLQPNTTYYYCLYANSGFMTIRSEIDQFTTDADGTPTFSEVTCSDVTDYTATLSCQLLDNGGHEMSTIGFCYKRVENGDYDLPTERDLVIHLNQNATTLEATLENLEPESEYIARAFGINRGNTGTGYSEPVTFNTSEEMTPVLSSIESLATTDLSITVRASVTNNQGRTIEEYGFCWSSENQSPTVAMSHQSCEVDENGTFQFNIENLNPNTTYYIRAYAINDRGQEGYSETYTFLTKGGVTVTTGDASNITDETAFISGEVNAQNYGIVRAKGFLYSTNADPTAEGNTRIEDWTNQGSYVSVTLNDLEIGVTYYYCAFAETTADALIYGEVKSFTTTITKPILEAPYVQEIMDKTATAQSTVTNRIELGHYGFEISTQAFPDGQFGSGTQIIYGEGYSGWQFAGQLTDLQPSTTYYLRAWAERGKGNQNATTIDPATADMDYYAFSEAITFTTASEIAVPTLADLQITETLVNSISLETTITSNGNYPIQGGGFCYTTDPNILPTRENNEGIIYIYSFTEDMQMAGTLDGLTPGTTYYIRGYAYNEYETGYSNVITVTTVEVAVPAVTDLQVIGIGKNSISLEMTITSNGNNRIQETGFCCTTDPNKLPTREDNEGITYYSGEYTPVELSLQNLTPGTTYYIRGYAYNGYETGYSEVITVTTMNNIPDIDDNPSPSIE